MGKPRVYEIAKDLTKQSKDIITMLKTHNIIIKNHMSTLEEKELDIILDHYTQENERQYKEFKARTEQNNTNANPKNREIKKDVISNKNGDTKKSEVNKSKENKKVVDKKDITDKATIDKSQKRHYDIRQNVVNLEKYENKRVEELASGLVEDIEEKEIKKNKKNKKAQKSSTDTNQHVEKKIKKIKIQEQVIVSELAKLLEVSSAEIIKNLMTLGVMAAVNQTIDFDTAALIASEFDAEAEMEIIISEEDLLLQEEKDSAESLKPRAPVVVVMGHVDHGKTSLLDSIRNTNVIETEAGGITQHIGAYRVEVSDKKITFLDTPGHEAFTAMRARGAQVTDIAILVVAADDGIMPQTVEAINHAKAAGVTIIIAINKIDKEGANPEKVKQELTEYGLVTEEWGGDTICVPISALKNEGIDNLLEMILLVTEMKELKANPDKKARGAVIESKLDKGRGPVATVLVQSGTLKIGDVLIAGTAMGKIRGMLDDKGKRIKEAKPSVPVEIQGLSEVPSAGDDFYVVKDEKMARNIVENRKQKIKDELLSSRQTVSLENLFEQIKEGEIKDLNIVLKADVQGSVEAVRQSLEKIKNDEVRINIIHYGVGAVNETDVMLAYTSNAIIIGFNVRPDSGARVTAEQHEVDIRLYRVIYEAIEEMEAAMKGMLTPKFKEVVLGHAEIRATFKVSGIGTIAGCYLTDGKINRNSEVRIVRDGIVVHEGTLASLKRFKDDAKEVMAGYECGIGIEKFNDIKEGDVIEAYIMEQIKE